MNKIIVIIKVAYKTLIEERKKSLKTQTTMCFAVQRKLQKLQGKVNPFLSSILCRLITFFSKHFVDQSLMQPS